MVNGIRYTPPHIPAVRNILGDTIFSGGREKKKMKLNLLKKGSTYLGPNIN